MKIGDLTVGLNFVKGSSPAQHTKDFRFSLKGVGDDGSFEGMAAVYGNTDLGGDVVEPGAFTKTLKDSNERPILWQHDAHEPIGMGTFVDSAKGLQVAGQLVLESPVAVKARALMRQGAVKGLSIGYDPVVSEYDRENDVRRLKELKLWETSIVTFPMNPMAQITGVKAATEEMEAAIARFLKEIESKTGRTLSAATLDRLKSAHGSLKEAMGHLESLMYSDQDPAVTCSADSLIDSMKQTSSLRWTS